MSSDLAAEKRRVRCAVSRMRRAVPADEAERAAVRIAERLLGEPAVRHARRIALYAALGDEVPTRPLYAALRRLHPQLLFPRVADERELAFAAVSDWSELRPGRYGVLEPPQRAIAIPPEAGDLVLVPGVAFDRAGHRLGRGKGFYDRTFPVAAPRPPLLLGIAFALQILDDVPHGAEDRRMDAVVTENALVWAEAPAS